jgi:hypothetical protein
MKDDSRQMTADGCQRTDSRGHGAQRAEGIEGGSGSKEECGSGNAEGGIRGKKELKAEGFLKKILHHKCNS